MNLYESNCVIVKGMTRLEKQNYFDEFGEDYWNDTENIICSPIADCDENFINNLKKFFGGDGDISKAQYLIMEF